jgi:hypothetical protein
LSAQSQSDLIWQASSGMLECYEARIVTTWSEYVRGVVIAQERGGSAGGYTAYVEYFKFGVARQVWAKRVFTDSDQAKTWCVSEITRLRRP